MEMKKNPQRSFNIKEYFYIKNLQSVTKYFAKSKKIK